VDDGRILRLRIEARSALCLRVGDSHRSTTKIAAAKVMVILRIRSSF
jgi:hypothetical protein